MGKCKSDDNQNVKKRLSTKNKSCVICNSTHKITHIDGNPYCSKHYEQITRLGEIRRTRFDKNEIITYDTYSEIIIYYKDGKEKGRVLISNKRIEKVRDIKWTIGANGYVYGRFNGKNTLLHRFLLTPKENEEVDHINHNQIDCRDENLRICTRSQNSRNTRPQKDTTSKYKGVYLSKSKNVISFTVQLSTEFGKINRVFRDELMAANFYNHLCKIYRYDDIEFCKLNDVPFIDLQTCCENVSPPEKSNTGLKGIRQIQNGRFRAVVYKNNKGYYVGTFDTLSEAKIAYDKKLKNIIELKINI